MAKTSTNDIFDKTSFLHGSNATYIEQMYKKYQTDPSQIPEDWQTFFSGLSKNLNEQNILRASWSNNNFPTEEDLTININSSWEKKSYKANENISTNISSDELKEQIYDSIRAIRLIRAFRVNGHLASKLDPLNLKEIKNRINSGLDIIGRDEQYEPIDLDERFPKYILNKRNELSKWIIN